jgi:hypothetical protein
MDLIDKLKKIGERFEKLKDQVQTEEATKNAFVMPFIAALGYDVFNPLEVVPEYTADIGIKKGEKVDYCILQEGNPIMIFECKHWRESLDPHKTQLHRYFHVTNGRFAILTNGIDYRFYTDLEDDNKMDEKPFLEFNLTKITEQITNELKRFQVDNFDADAIISVASDLKYSKEIKDVLSQELKSPSDDFVKYFASKVYSGRVTAKVLEQFTVLVRNSSKSLINELINERLQSALDNESISEVTESQTEEEPLVEDAVPNKKGIETTEEEKQGYRIIQSILAESVDIKRVTYRDTKSYFSILLDNNNRKTICRLWLNRSIKYLEVFDKEKVGEKILVNEINDIYSYKSKIVESALNFMEE